MLYHNNPIENTQNQFSNAVKELCIGKLYAIQIFKILRVPAFEVFQFLLLLVEVE
jgi:hypothetical protein